MTRSFFFSYLILAALIFNIKTYSMEKPIGDLDIEFGADANSESTGSRNISESISTSSTQVNLKDPNNNFFNKETIWIKAIEDTDLLCEQIFDTSFSNQHRLLFDNIKPFLAQKIDQAKEDYLASSNISKESKHFKFSVNLGELIYQSIENILELKSKESEEFEKKSTQHRARIKMAIASNAVTITIALAVVLMEYFLSDNNC